MAKKRKKKKAKTKIEQVKTEPEEKVVIGDELRRPLSDLKPLPGIKMETEPELSETPVIKDEQATAPAKPKSATIERPEVDVELKPDGGYEVRPSPSAEERIMPGGPVPLAREDSFTLLCAGCKGIFKPDIMRECKRCKLYFCEICAKPGVCHACGKALE